MNIMAPRYGFNLDSDRFDTQVMSAYQQGKMIRHSRDALIAQVRGGRWNHLLLNRLEGLGGIPQEVGEKAAVNIIDYYFESRVLTSMTDNQLHDYFCAFSNTLRVDSIGGVDSGAPLWVETVHHACVFSILYDLILHLARYHGYRRAVLLHQGQRPEPRLAIIAKLLQKMHNIQPHFVQLHGNWLSTLAKTATPDTVILYLSDVPPNATGQHAGKERDPSQLYLTAPPGIVAAIDIMAAGAILARRLKARHVVLEYPGPDRIRVRPFDAANQVVRLPMEDWVFWPLLKVA